MSKEVFEKWFREVDLKGLCGVDALRTAFEAGLAAAPTPEVEPVARCDNRGMNGILWQTTDFPKEGTLLYTHPAPNDELRRAADELLKDIYDPCFDITPKIEALRAALAKVKS